VQSLKFYYKNNFCESLLLKALETRLFYRSPKYSNDQRDINSNEIDSNFTARETQDYAPLQRQATNNQANSQNFKTLIEFTYSDLPCHFKVKKR